MQYTFIMANYLNKPCATCFWYFINVANGLKNREIRIGNREGGRPGQMTGNLAVKPGKLTGLVHTFTMLQTYDCIYRL